VSAPPDLARCLDEAANGLIIRNVGAGWFVATGANLQNELVVLAFRGSDSIGAIWQQLAEAPSPSRIDPAGLDDAEVLRCASGRRQAAMRPVSVSRTMNRRTVDLRGVGTRAELRKATAGMSTRS
jgi:hypothetical protein